MDRDGVGSCARKLRDSLQCRRSPRVRVGGAGDFAARFVEGDLVGGRWSPWRMEGALAGGGEELVELE